MDTNEELPAGAAAVVNCQTVLSTSPAPIEADWNDGRICWPCLFQHRKPTNAEKKYTYALPVQEG
ncbi:MAG: hypothetical protein V1916_00565 [Patescibacteria group bacterium]